MVLYSSKGDDDGEDKGKYSKGKGDCGSRARVTKREREVPEWATMMMGDGRGVPNSVVVDSIAISRD